jgi:hypothetical protein
MKKIGYLFLSLFVLGLCFQSCDDSETYADLKKKERRQIQSFIEKHNINVITESEFFAQDSTTDVSKNEYVLFNDNGVYMQIEKKGSGEKIKDKEWKEILVRFWEVYVETGDTTSVSNKLERDPDVFMCKNTSGSFTASFTSGNMYSTYGSAVPKGWLVPLSYINLGRIQSDLAKVRIIVPHSAGHSDASSSVYPCFYEITYQVGR